jgi:hypothetical protein
MKTFMRGFCSVLSGFFILMTFNGAFAADTNPLPRLTVELRDGSRVVGDSVEKYFKFHSTLLGDLKLEVKDIRSIECVSSNSAKLSTANGDLLTVSFVASEFAVKTSFGKVNLSVDLVCKLSVSAGGTGANPPGLVALWSGDGAANDSVGGNHGALHGGVSFASGKVGQAFNFNGIDSYVNVPSSPAIKMTGPFTIVAWINYLRTSGVGNNAVSVVTKGIDAATTMDWGLGISPGQKLRPYAQIGADWIYFDCDTILNTGVWYHVAMVYNGTNIQGYVNGTLDGSKTVSGVLQATDYPLRIGTYASVLAPGFFPGEIDELAIYNRALSASEIQTIYAEQK